MYGILLRPTAWNLPSLFTLVTSKLQCACLQVYGILLRHSACVQALSCDEAYLDVTGKATVALECA